MEFDNLDNALLDFGQRIVDEMQNQLFENKSVNTGDLARSITKNIVNNNDTETLQVSLLWYGELLEDGGPGRRAGRMPPILPIEANFGDEAITAGVEADLIIDINKAFIESGAIIT